ncbi:hypothetical protein CAPTEDRAFT_131450, partial [Capitella teleta]
SSVRAVVILGTGDFSRALSTRLVANGYRVTMGSRRPERRNISARSPHLSGVRVLGQEDAVAESEVVFLGIPSTSVMETLLPIKASLRGKVLVDVSNPEVMTKGATVAELLRENFPECDVVKGFNTLSAYSLESGQSLGSMVVHLASDSSQATEKVAAVARDIGLQCVVRGGLNTTRALEDLPREAWGGWGVPLLVSFAVWLLWTIYGTWRYHIHKTHAAERWPVNTNNKIAGCAAITLLALCYLPGSIAAIVQLKNGSKHQAFPRCLDRWLKMRKQLGLMALASASLHCVLSLAHISPAYFKKWYDVRTISIPANQTSDMTFPIDSRMNWIGEVTVYLGSIALLLLCSQGVASLPSVTERLNWRRWWLLQSVVGHIGLLFAVTHVAAKVLPFIFSRPFSTSVQGMSFLSNLLPSFTLLLRICLLLPCLGIPLRKIRNGWERGVDDEEQGVVLDGVAKEEDEDGAVCRMEEI